MGFEKVAGAEDATEPCRGKCSMLEKRNPSCPRSCRPLTRAENIAICCAPSFHKPRTRNHRRAGEEGVEKAEAGIASIDRSGGHAGGSWQRWIRRLYFRVAHGRPMTLVELAVGGLTLIPSTASTATLPPFPANLPRDQSQLTYLPSFLPLDCCASPTNDHINDKHLQSPPGV